MRLPRTVSDVVSEHVTFEVECIERMYLDVYVPGLQYPAGLVGYVHRQLGLPIASTAPLGKITDAFSAAVRCFAGDHGVPWVDFVKGQRKDDVMHERLAGFTGKEGVVFIGRAQEKTPLFRAEKRRDAEGKTYPWIVKTTGLADVSRRRLRDLLGLPGLIGASILAFLVVVAAVGPMVTSNDGLSPVADPWAAPRPGLWLGADDVGKDLFAQLIVGTRMSLLVGIAVALAVTGIAAVIGGTAAVGPPWLSAARAMGAPARHLLLRHASYVVAPLLIPIFVRAAMAAVLADASLSFLGLGDPTVPSWGTILYWASTNGAFLTEAWARWPLPPGLAITVTMVALGLIGVAVEERLNPILRKGR